MRKFLLLAAAAVALGGLVTGTSVVLAQAQPAPPPPGPAMPRPPAPPGPPWMHDRPGRMGGWGHGGAATFGLLYRPADRQLGAADVQKIAEGFLLWNGNHSWKVTDVKEQDDNTVSFAFATPGGDVVARFSMDRHTGRLSRTG